MAPVTRVSRSLACPADLQVSEARPVRLLMVNFTRQVPKRAGTNPESAFQPFLLPSPAASPLPEPVSPAGAARHGAAGDEKGGSGASMKTGRENWTSQAQTAFLL